MTATTLDQSAPPPCIATGPAVWDRLWKHRPSAQRDDALLDREARGPRWKLIKQELVTAFGTLHGLKTIELGSGRGDLSVLLARHGAQVTLLDQSNTALDEARHRFDRLELKAKFIQADLFASDADHIGAYDLAFSLGVAEHFRGAERTQILRAHARVLRPGGMVVVSVPHAGCIPYRLWKWYLERRGWWPYGMELPFTHREMRRRAAAAGLEQITTTGMGLWQSIGDHWVRRLTCCSPDWFATPSRLDHWLGLALLLIARTPPDQSCDPCSDRDGMGDKLK